MDMGLGFQNEITGNVASDPISGFVFDNVWFNGGLLTDENLITTGEMDASGWTAVQNGTDLTTTFGSTLGTGGGWGLLSKTTNMNGQANYTNVCNSEFSIANNEMITISYWAKATAAGKLLTPFVQDVSSAYSVYFTQVSLTTNFTRYHSTFQVATGSTDFKIKFRGFSTAWIYLDKVQVGRKDWITLTDMIKGNLDTPTFLPVLKSTPISTPVTTTREDNGIFPNPVSDVLFIRGSNFNTKYQVFTLSGSLEFSGQGTQFNTTRLNAGMYILVTNDNQRMKFVKK